MQSINSIRANAGQESSIRDYLTFYAKVWIVWPVLDPARRIFSGLKGKFWCRKFHRPLLTGVDSYNGIDWTGRWRRGEIQRKRCLVCGNTWLVREDSKPLTLNQCIVGHAMFGNMWVGPKTQEGFDEYQSKTNALAGGEDAPQ